MRQLYELAVFNEVLMLEIVEERERISVLPGTRQLPLVLDHPDRAGRDVSSLRVGVTGAADIPVELIRRVREELPLNASSPATAPHRSGHGHRLQARRRLRAHRHDRRRRVARVRGTNRERVR